MVSINSKGYNVAEVNVGTKLVASESVTIGTQKDFDALWGFAETGVMRVIATVTIGGNDMQFNGCVVCNKFGVDVDVPGIEFSTIIFASDTITGGSPIIVGGQLYMDGTNLKCHITATPLGD